MCWKLDMVGEKMCCCVESCQKALSEDGWSWAQNDLDRHQRIRLAGNRFDRTKVTEQIEQTVVDRRQGSSDQKQKVDNQD